MLDDWVFHFEDIYVEPEGLARLDGLPIQMSGTQHERPRPVGQPTGPDSFGPRWQSGRLEYPGISALYPSIAFTHVPAGVPRTFRHTGDPAQHAPQGPPHNVSGHSRRKADGIARREGEPERVKIEGHNPELVLTVPL
jgi:hypothetical protein